jgi:transcription elongation factor Elf1
MERSFAVPSASHLAGTVTLVDATGHHHPISVNFCASYQQLNNTLRVLFERDAIEAEIQRRYIEEGEYDLCIDEGTQVTPLTSDKWSSIEPGTKIVMRVTIQQKISSLSEIDYQCHFCGAVNRLSATSVKYASLRQVVCSTDCGKCTRRFQITRGYLKQRTRIFSSDSKHTTDAEMPLIRNFHVNQINRERRRDILLDLWWRDRRIREQTRFLRRVHENPVVYP